MFRLINSLQRHMIHDAILQLIGFLYNYMQDTYHLCVQYRFDRCWLITKIISTINRNEENIDTISNLKRKNILAFYNLFALLQCVIVNIFYIYSSE